MEGLRAELNAEIKKARIWLIVVGALMFVIDMIFIFVVSGRHLGSDTQMKLAGASAAILVVFLLLAYFTAKKPQLCMILGLVLFWGIQIFNASQDPDGIARGLSRGILIKVFFTLALIRGLRSAKRAKEIITDLEKVFE